MLNRDNLHTYQHAAINYIKGRLKCGLFLDMGLGKTATTLTAISDLFDNIEIGRVLIIAPLRVANTVWQQETTKWSHLSHLDVGIATGTPKARSKVIAQGHAITVINRECLVWLCDNYPFKYDMVIIDESSRFKNHASKAFKTLKKTIKQYNKVSSSYRDTIPPRGNGLMEPDLSFRPRGKIRKKYHSV